jgi:AraC family transcriptional regulator
MTYDIRIDAPLNEARLLLDEVRQGLEGDLEMARRGAERLLVLLSTRLCADAPRGLVPWRRRRVEAFILEHLSEPLLCEELAMVAGLSVSHFSRLFRQSFGCSPRAYVTRLRLDRARDLMITTDAPLSQIALACGLSDQSRLSKLFRKVAGQSPRAWRRLHARPEAAAAEDEPVLLAPRRRAFAP